MSNLKTGDDLYELAKSVSSKTDFDHFLDCLVEDFRVNSKSWENADLLQYLQGLAAFAKKADAYYKNMNDDVDATKFSWRLMCQILLAGSVYGN